MRYTLNQLKNNKKIVVYLETKTDWQKLFDLKMFNITVEYHGSYCYSLIDDTYSGSSTKTNPGAYNHDTIIVQFDEIDFDINIENKEFLESISCPYQEGDLLEGKIADRWISEMVLHVENKHIFLCQNSCNSMKCIDKQGYSYSYNIYDEYPKKNWEDSLHLYKVTELCYINTKTFTKLTKDIMSDGLPKYFCIEYNDSIINKLIELFPDSQVKDEYNEYGGGSLNYIGRTEDYEEFTINDKSYFEHEDVLFITSNQFNEFLDAKYSVKGEFDSFSLNTPLFEYQQVDTAIKPISQSEVNLISFSKITDKKSKQITKLFKF